VTETDALGNGVTYLVRTNKMTGEIVSKEPIGKTTKPLTQQDKDAATAFKKSMDLIDKIEQQYDPKIVGPIDTLSAWIGNKAGIATDDTKRHYELDSTLQNLKANLTAALIKGVPSDKDMAVIEGMMPSSSDSEPVFKAKLKNIKEILNRQGLQFTKDRLEPVGAGEIGISTPKPETPEPPKPDSNSTKWYGDGYEIITY